MYAALKTLLTHVITMEYVSMRYVSLHLGPMSSVQVVLIVHQAITAIVSALDTLTGLRSATALYPASLAQLV